MANGAMVLESCLTVPQVEYAPNKPSPQYILKRNKICSHKTSLVHNIYCITAYNQRLEASVRMNYKRL